MKPKGVTTQMKALNEYFLMVVFTLLLNRVHVFAIFMFNFDRKKHGSQRVNKIRWNTSHCENEQARTTLETALRTYKHVHVIKVENGRVVFF